MNTNSNNKISERLKALTKPLPESDAFDIERKLLSARFLSEIQKHLDSHSLKKKEFAKIMSVSPSYVTQLFLGEKLVNIDFLTRVQKKLDLKFYVSTVDHSEFESLFESSLDKISRNISMNMPKEKAQDPDGFWVYKSFSDPDYNNIDTTLFNTKEKVA